MKGFLFYFFGKQQLKEIYINDLKLDILRYCASFIGIICSWNETCMSESRREGKDEANTCELCEGTLLS